MIFAPLPQAFAIPQLMVPVASDTVPAPLPKSDMESVGLNRAEITRLVFMRILHGDRLEPQPASPAHPAKATVLAETAVKVTVEPAGKETMQAVLLLPHCMPVAGLVL